MNAHTSRWAASTAVVVTILLAPAVGFAQVPDSTENASQAGAAEPLRTPHVEPLPEAAIARFGSTHLRSVRGVASLTYSPDGKWLVGAGSDGTVYIWSPIDGRLLRRYWSGARSVFFTPDGREMVGLGTSLIRRRLPDLESIAESRRSITDRQALAREASLRGQSVHAVRKFVPLPAIGSLTVVRTEDGSELFETPAGRGFGYRFTPDESLLLVATGVYVSRKPEQTRHAMEVWDVEKRQRLFDLDDFQWDVRDVAVTSDNRRLFTAAKRLAQWDLTTGKRERLLLDEELSRPELLLSPDEHTLLLWDAGTLHLFDVATGKHRLTLDVGRNIGCAAFSPDSRELAIGGFGPVQIFDVRTGIECLPHTEYLPASYAMELSPDDRYLAFSSGLIFDLAQRKLARDRQDATSALNMLQYSPDGKRIAYRDGKTLMFLLRDGDQWKTQAFSPSRSTGGRPRLIASPDSAAMAAIKASGAMELDPLLPSPDERRQPRLTIPGHIGPVSAAKFSGDHRRLASCGVDNSLRVWDTATGREVWRVKVEVGDKRPVNVALSADGALVVAAAGGKLRVWKVGTEQPTLEIDVTATAVALSEDGETIITGDEAGRLSTWRRTDGKRLRSQKAHDAPIRIVFESPRAALLCTADDKGRVRLWEPRGLQRKADLKGPGRRVTAVCFSRDATQLAVGHSDGTVITWNVADGEQIHRIAAVGGGVSLLAYWPDDKNLTCINGGSTISRYDVETGALSNGRIALNGTADASFNSFAFSSDGRQIALAAPSAIRLYDVADGRHAVDLLTAADQSGVVAFSPDGEIIAAGGKGITLWNRDHEKLAHLYQPKTGEVKNLAFSPDGRLLACTGTLSAVQLRDGRTGELLRSIPTSKAMHAKRMQFTPDGRVLMAFEGTAVGHDAPQKTLTFWDVATGRRLGSFRGQPFGTHGFCLSRDGRRLVTAGYDGIVYLWDFARVLRAGESSGGDKP